eukprot:gene10336-11411_t
MSPRQLWHYGMSRLLNTNPEAPEAAGVNAWADYGIDEESPFPAVETSNDVRVPETRIRLCEEHILHLAQTIDPLTLDGNEGADVYQLALRNITLYKEQPCCSLLNDIDEEA